MTEIDHEDQMPWADYVETLTKQRLLVRYPLEFANVAIDRCEMVLPRDLTKQEADRLCAMIQTLPFEEKP